MEKIIKAAVERGASDLHIKAGDKLVIPAGALHAEGKVEEKMVYIIGTAEASNLMEALRIHPPEV